jgi:CRISPR/Cas system CSM-associated protein Csm4 (group 5 of RAMP superfamily)
MGQITDDLLSVGKVGKKYLWTNRSGKQKLGIGATALYLGNKYIVPDTVSSLTNKKNDIEKKLEDLKTQNKETTIKLKEKVRKEDEYNESIKKQTDERRKQEKILTDKNKPIPDGDGSTPGFKLDPVIALGAAAAGLGYLAIKRMRAKRAERRFAEQDFNRQYS